MVSIPITLEDLAEIEAKIGIDQDEFCPYCDGKLETVKKIPFSIGIFYICRQCGKKFKKTNYRSFGWGEDYFILKEEKE